MQLPSNVVRFDARKIEQTLSSERKFITDLFSILSLPKRNEDNEDGDEVSKQIQVHNPENKPTRAQTLSELQERLGAITSKKKLTYKEKLKKKHLKNQMKKKTKRDERNSLKKLERAQKLTNGVPEIKPEENNTGKQPAKPVFNGEQSLVFSKIDVGNESKETTKKKHKKDPKKLLENLQKQKEKLNELENEGEIEKVVMIKETNAWKNALAKAEGEKVKDDPSLLKKTVQRNEQKKKSSKKKWEARIEGVQKTKEERQKKRKENIDKKKKEKQKKKFKTAEKKGRIVLK